MDNKVLAIFLALILLLTCLICVVSCGDDDDDDDDTGSADDDDDDDDDDNDDDDNDDDDTDWGYPWTLSDGMINGCTGEIAYNFWEYDDVAEATLVFVNGRTEYTDKYHHIIEHIERPWNIVMFDHYGQGRSNGPRGHADDFDTQHVCDMYEVIDTLADPDLPIVIIAHSMGGFISARFAELYPEVAQAYVLSSPMLGFNADPFSPEVARLIAKLMVALGFGQLHAPGTQPGIDPPVPFEENILTHDEELYNMFAYDPITLIGQPTFGWGNAAYTELDRIYANTDKIAQNVKLFLSGDDRLVPPAGQYQFCDSLNALRPGACSPMVFDGDYHELFNELDREDVIEAALEFLDDELAK